MKATEIDVRTAKMLLEPLHGLESTIETEGDWAIALAIYRSEETFRCFHVTGLAKEVITVGERFCLRPLLDAVTREQRFYVLALSQKRVRLFDCGTYRIEEVALQGRVPSNLQSFLNTKMPDHVLDARSSGGPGVGSMKGVVFGTSSDRDKHNEYLAHYFRAIDTGVHRVLASGNIPLVLAGVEEELALYRKINTHKYLLEEDVYGSPDGVALKELHHRALDLVRKKLVSPAAKVVREFEDYRGVRRVALDLGEILARASEGRVSDLLVREDAERRGTWSRDTQKIREAGESEDLINVAVVETLLHGGQAYSLRAAEMPEGSEVAAVLRY